MNLSHFPAAVIFDMDGLLFDTETLDAESIQDATQKLGREFPTTLFRRMLGNPWPTNPRRASAPCSGVVASLHDVRRVLLEVRSSPVR